MPYPRHDIKAPHLTGNLLRLAVRLAENEPTATLLRAQMLGQVGVDRLRAARVDEPPCPWPHHPAPVTDVPTGPPDLVDLATRRGDKPGPFETVTDFREAYASGRTTPRDVAGRLLRAVEESERHAPPLRVFIALHADDVRRDAEAATQRHREGKVLGPLDGVPVAVKDELDVQGYGTTVGTSFLGREPAARDATVVARLRAAGAVVVGKANMHEIGIGVTGLNPHHGACRNPYDPGHKTGGSSSGPAAAVAAGFCPVAVAADGGGSIRIPAALCGQVGLKATFGRVSEVGAAPLCWSVAHVGPVAATARDCALAYAVMAGPDVGDPHTLAQPPLGLPGFDDAGLQGLRVGVYRAWSEDADPAVVSLGRGLEEGLRRAGATVREVEIPDLALFHVAHLVTIVSEMEEAHRAWLTERRADYGLDVRLNVAVARGLRSSDYVRAQRLRGRAMAVMARVLEEVDVVLTPATAIPAPPIATAALACGESHLSELNALMRYATLANLTGLPAISFPAGYTAGGLPVGYQAMGRPWEEALLLRVAHVVEGFTERRPPRWHARLLGEG
jgi:Asp-tRNA(Asn)/Glu-tRNA(Gln) amidotransferase A subunit family amidase